MTFIVQKLLFILGLPLLVVGEILTRRRLLKITYTQTNLIYGIRILGNKSYIYIGKTDMKNFEIRQKRHIRNSFTKKHNNKKLQQAIRGSGYAVTFDILEYCNSENVFRREGHYINKHLSSRLCNEIIPNKV